MNDFQAFLPPHVVNESAVALPQTQTVDWGNVMLNIATLHERGYWGEGFTAAVIDTGVDEAHPDLKEAIVSFHNVTAENFNYGKANGHGIGVAGVIGARNNNTGIIGVAPKCGIVAIKAMRENGGGSITEIVKGIDLAIAKKVDVINLSLGTTANISSLRNAINRAMDAGIVVVCSAGNAGQDDSVVYPARYPGTVAVGAINQSMQVSAFSSRGTEVDVAAPGERVLTCWTKKGYSKVSGTSFSAPYVAGLVLLFKEAGLNIANLHQIIEDTSIDIEEPGEDVKSGHGLINPVEAVNRYGDTPVDEPPPPPEEECPPCPPCPEIPTADIEEAKDIITDIISKLDNESNLTAGFGEDLATLTRTIYAQAQRVGDLKGKATDLLYKLNEI